MRLVFEGKGGGEIYLAVENGEMKAVKTAPAGLVVRMALAVPVDAAKAALEMIEREDLLSHPKAHKRIARTASAETDKMLEMNKLEFHLMVTDLPAEPEEVTVRVALGRAEIIDDSGAMGLATTPYGLTFLDEQRAIIAKLPK